MIVVTIGKFIDEALSYTNMVANGEIVEIVLKNGETLQLTKKEKKNKNYI